MLNRAADMFDRGRDYIAPVGNGRCTEYQHQFSAQREQFFNCGRKCGFVMRHPAFGNDTRAGRRETLFRHVQRLLDHLWCETRQQRGDNADALDPERLHPHSPCTDSGHSSIAQLGFDAERNDLDGGNHLTRNHRLEGRQRRKGDRFIDPIDAIDGIAVHHQYTGFRREQVGASGERTLDVDAVARHRRGNARCRFVLRDVVLVETRDHDFLDACLLQRCHLGEADDGAFFKHKRALTYGVNRNAAESIFRFNGTEFHAADFVLSGVSAGSRSLAVISAMIATAISDGETAPICRPIGAWIRASDSSLIP